MSRKKQFLLIAVLTFLTHPLLFSQKNILDKKEKVSDAVYDICFTPKGGFLAAANGRSVILYELSTGGIIRKFENGHNKDILSIDISPDSSMLASGGKDSTIILWSMTTGGLIRKIKNHSGVVTQVRFSPDGNYLYSSGSDGRIVLYSIPSDATVYGKKVQKKIITSFDVSNSESIVAITGSDGRVLILNSLTGEILNTLSTGNGWLRDISFSPDGSKLIAGCDNGKVLIWEVDRSSNFKQITKNRIAKNWIYGVDFRSDNIAYAYCGFDENFYVILLADKYYFTTGTVVFKVRFKPETGSDIIVAAATLGKGVILKKASEMLLEK